MECILTPEGEFFFLEVNARIQVEHPITEATTGVDLVEEQLLIAAGSGMSLDASPPQSGHALECRISAEDPVRFLPSPGRVTRLRLPEGVRCEFGYDEGDEVPVFYDPLVGKLVASGADRGAAIEAMCAALNELVIDGPKTNVPAHLSVLGDERFLSGAYDTGILAA